MMWKILLLSLTSCAWASHFRGAIVQWRPINPANFDGRVRTFIFHYFYKFGLKFQVLLLLNCIICLHVKCGEFWLIE